MRLCKCEKKTIVTHAYCDCGGELVFDTGRLFTDLLTGRDKFEHICRKCGMKVTLDKLYPDENEIEVEVK